jgi:hypothetical protein
MILDLGGINGRNKANNAIRSTEVQEKRLNSLLEKYGQYPISSEAVRDRIKETMLDRYGVDNPLKNIDIKNRVKQTCMLKYRI